MITAIIAAVVLSVTPISITSPFDHNQDFRSVTIPPTATPAPAGQNVAIVLLKADLNVLLSSLGKAFGGTATLGEVRYSSKTGAVMAHVDVAVGTEMQSAVYVLVFDKSVNHFVPVDFFMMLDLNR